MKHKGTINEQRKKRIGYNKENKMKNFFHCEGFVKVLK